MADQRAARCQRSVLSRSDLTVERSEPLEGRALLAASTSTPAFDAASTLGGSVRKSRLYASRVDDQSTTLLIALLGGVGGALLAGVFQALTSAWSDARKARHDLDAWLREKRLTQINRLLELILESASKTDTAERHRLAHEIFDASIPLRTVLPKSLQPVVIESVDLVREELFGEASVRAAKAISWQGGFLQGVLPAALGWDQEASTRGARRFGPRRRRSGGHPRSENARDARSSA